MRVILHLSDLLEFSNLPAPFPSIRGDSYLINMFGSHSHSNVHAPVLRSGVVAGGVSLL